MKKIVKVFVIVFLVVLGVSCASKSGKVTTSSVDSTTVTNTLEVSDTVSATTVK